MSARSALAACALAAFVGTTLSAQEQTTLLASGDGWLVESYGHDALQGQAMTLRVGFEPVLDVEPVQLAFDSGPAWLTVSRGQAGAPLALLVGFASARIPLAPLADGTLLVQSPPIAVAGAFEIDGRWALMIDVNRTTLSDAQLFAQAVAVVQSEFGPALRLSDGMRIGIEQPPVGDPD